MCKKIPLISLCLAAALVFTGCGIGDDSEGRMDVVAGFYPLAYISEQIGGDTVKVQNLAKPGVEPHDLELSPKQVTRIADADLAVYLKGFQPEFDEAVIHHNKDRGFDASKVEPLLDGYVPLEAEDEQKGGHKHEVAEDAKGKDPHVWLSPIRLAGLVEALAKRFSEIEPDHAEKFQKAGAELRGKLQALDQEVSGKLQNCQSRSFVVNHNAFGYFAERYNLKQIAISGLSPETEPSPERLAEVARLAKENNVKTVFFESLVSPKVSETIAREIGAKTAELDPMESKPKGGDYFSQTRANTEALRTALRCG